MKNGYEFTAESCRKVGNQIEIEVESGTIMIQSSDVRSAKTFERLFRRGRQNGQKPKATSFPSGQSQPSSEAKKPAKGKTQPPVEPAPDTSEQRKNLEWRLSDLRSRIAPLEEEQRSLVAERKTTAQRLEDLKKEGRAKAINNMQDPLIKWREYLLSADRSWLVDAEPKLAELDTRIRQLEENLKPLKSDEQYLEKRIHELK